MEEPFFPTLGTTPCGGPGLALFYGPFVLLGPTLGTTPCGGPGPLPRRTVPFLFVPSNVCCMASTRVAKSRERAACYQAPLTCRAERNATEEPNPLLPR